MPYHMQAMPAPRRRGEPLAAAARVERRRGRRAPSPRRPQRVEAGAQADARRERLPGRRRVAGDERVAVAELERVAAERAASSSISSSPSSVDCGTPKPRNAPATLLWVSTARVSARTLGTRYGPLAWIGTRLATVGPHDE